MAMPSTLSLVQKKNPKKPDESFLEYEDRMDCLAYWELKEKQDSGKKLTKKEEAELEKLGENLGAASMVEAGQIPEHFFDKDLKPLMRRIRREFVEEYGDDTATKRLLLDRLMSSLNLAWSSERMFFMNKYRVKEDDSYSYNSDSLRTAYSKESRLGLAAANDQIIRITSALKHINEPPLNVTATNAYFANMQQINNPAKDSGEKDNKGIITEKV